MSSSVVTLSELRIKWTKDKGHYRHQEVGSGVQSFVKDVLGCPSLFDLEEGRLSTPLANRKNEFIQEKVAKQQRQADFVLYVSPDVVIPLEVKLYGRVDEGHEQLIQYQTDFDKDYGILTDGYSWYFYNGDYREKKFVLDTILQEPILLREYWKEYIKPKYYYLRYFEKAGQQELFDMTRPVEKQLDRFSKDLTILIESFMAKLQLEGYFDGSPKEERRTKAAEITYAYVIQFILYKTLVDNAFGDFREEYQKDVEVIHRNIKEQTYKNILGIMTKISSQISKNIYRPFRQEQKYISEKLWQLFEKRENTVSDISPWLDIYVFIKKYDFQDVQTEIFGVVYENYLKHLYEGQELGQYFTDPEVVRFMLRQIGYTRDTVKAKVTNGETDKLSIIDPACGSGTFLYSAVNSIIKALPEQSPERAKEIEELVNNNVFGLDIAEFPLYLAEMSILMRMLPLIFTEKYNNPIQNKIKVFYTKDSIAEFKGLGVEGGEELRDREKGQLRLGLPGQEPAMESYIRDPKDLYDMKYSLQQRGNIPRRRFDYVIANPPYVSYNKCCKQKLLSFEWIKEGKFKLNNIYGVNLHSVPGNPKKYRPNPNLFVFFIALGLALLKDDGKLCYIIPQTILVNPDFDVIRYHLAKFTTIEKVIILSRKMFIGRGIKQNKPVPTSSLVLVVNRRIPHVSHNVEVVHYKDPNADIKKCLADITKGERTGKKKIAQVKLLENVANWNFVKLDKPLEKFWEGYKKNTQDMAVYYTHTRRQRESNSRFYFDGGYSIDEQKLLSHPAPDVLNYECPVLDEKYWSIKSCAGYWPNIRDPRQEMFIKLRQGNQQYHFLDSKYKVIWSYNNTSKFFFTDKKLIWARNKFLGIASNSETEVLYLFALLNSSITSILLRNMVRIQNEDRRTILVSLQIIKDQIRVPEITEGNRFIKDEVITCAQEMLALEEKTLSDFVDLSAVLMQRFEQVRVEGDSLVLVSDGKQRKLKIQRKPDLVSKVLAEKYRIGELKLTKAETSLYELTSLAVIDSERQEELKDYIDHLVFALYFKVPLSKAYLEKQDYNKIKSLCSESEYHNLVFGP